MPYVSVFVEQSEIDAIVDRAIEQLGPDVVNVNYNVGVDNTGDPCIRFRVVLTDEAARPDVLFERAERVRKHLWKEIDPLGKWNLFPYTNFRSQSEQAQLQSPEWA